MLTSCILFQTAFVVMSKGTAWVIDKEQETLSEVLEARKTNVKGPAFAKGWFASAEHGRGNHKARV